MYQTARELFEAAREAARDAERCRRQLEAMERRADGLGGGGFEPRVRSTPDHDRMAGRVAALVDQGDRLERRQAEDYRLIDAACAVLYGDESDGGLYALVGWPADAIYHHYLALRTWDETADMLMYSKRRVLECVSAALELADANGLARTRLGVGMAEG